MEAYYTLIALLMVSVNGRYLMAMQSFADAYVTERVSMFWLIQPFMLPTALLVGLTILSISKADIMVWILLTGVAFEIVCGVYRKRTRKKLNNPS
mgnify:CR=1 FL=1